VLKTGAMLCY